MARLTPEKWEEVKAVYCVGKRTLEDIGEEFGVSHVAISRRAKAEKWQKLDANLIDGAIDARSKVTKVTESYNLVTSIVNSEIDRHASDKVKADNIGMLLLDRAAELARDCYDAGELQKLSATHKNIYDGRFKTTVDSAIQINNNNESQTPSRIRIVAPKVIPNHDD
jgi:hypothetical protein